MAVSFSKINFPEPFEDRGINQRLIATGLAINVIRNAVLDIEPVELEEAQATSFLGTPVLDYVEFPAGKYIDLEGAEISYSGFRLDAVLVEVNLPKNIVKTPIQGLNGTVKEYISDGDYEISIRGVINNQQNQIPLDDLTSVRYIFNAPVAIDITSQLLNEIFDIDKIVVTDYSINQIEGYRNQLAINIRAISDFDIELEDVF
jgi:hypothetical protein